MEDIVVFGSPSSSLRPDVPVDPYAITGPSRHSAPPTIAAGRSSKMTRTTWTPNQKITWIFLARPLSPSGLNRGPPRFSGPVEHPYPQPPPVTGLLVHCVLYI